MMFEMLSTTAICSVAAIGACVISSRFRIVVGTSEVHIVQHASMTTTYGKDQPSGNVYYHWPAWIPRAGVRSTALPSAVFALELKDYPAYDKGRVPFQLDVIGFFRITDFSSASARVIDMKNLEEQLRGILQGAMRSILASSEIEDILEGRSEFGRRFTEEVDTQLTQWGVQSVKAIELMDIRDAEGRKVIANIMAKKISHIEMQSRTEVAANMQKAQVAELEAQQVVAIREAHQQEEVGKRKAQRDQEVGMQNQRSLQAVAIEEAKTEQANMGVKRITIMQEAEIARDAAVVAAEQARRVTVVNAEAARDRAALEAAAQKSRTVTVAEGDLASQQMQATAAEAIGMAKGAAEQAVLMAPVNAQIALAKEIGENRSYQEYLLAAKQIEAGQMVGMESARAMQAAGIKIVATGGTPAEGIKSVLDIMTPKGATQLGAALEAFGNTDMGKTVLAKLNGSADSSRTAK